LGGAIGNLIDRLRFGYVTDFIDIRLWGNFHWPAFNFADSAIVVGTLTLTYALFRSGLFKKIYDGN
jgi:signal peptidase II